MMVSPSRWKLLYQLFNWNRSSYLIMSGFLMVLLLLGYLWQPLLVEYLAYIDWNGPWWLYIDWLLIGIFFTMSLLIMAGADLRTDALLIFVGIIGGFVIESWGTQTALWRYYTNEKPPLWIIPAWPIANLSIDRLVRLLNYICPQRLRKQAQGVYWFVFLSFYVIMLAFVAPTLERSLTWAALALCATLILFPANYYGDLLNFIAGAGLGYFLERWGTTRQCWIYYSLQTPPFFAVLAHGMAAVAFWRAKLLLETFYDRLKVHRKRLGTDRT